MGKHVMYVMWKPLTVENIYFKFKIIQSGPPMHSMLTITFYFKNFGS